MILSLKITSASNHGGHSDLQQNLLGGRATLKPPQHYRAPNPVAKHNNVQNPQNDESQDNFYSSIAYVNSLDESFSSERHYSEVPSDHKRYSDQPAVNPARRLKQSGKRSIKTAPHKYPTSKLAPKTQSSHRPGHFNVPGSGNEQEIYANVSTEPVGTFQTGEYEFEEPGHSGLAPNSTSQMGVYEFELPGQSQSRPTAQGGYEVNVPIRSIDEEDDETGNKEYSYACVGKPEVSSYNTVGFSCKESWLLE